MAVNKQLTGVNFEKILQSLHDDVENLRTEYEEIGCPINDDDTHLHQFCERLEFLLTCGLRERVGLLGSRRDVWHYFCRCLADRRNIHDGLKVVKANTELKTGLGRVRCLVRYCLVHRCLADVIQQCVQNHTVTRQCYQDGAPLLQPTLAQAFYTTLYHLSDICFDLPPSGSDLDLAWPTFTRLGMGSWQPPSRTLSVSSLYSQVSEAPSLQSPLSAGMMGPVGEVEDQPATLASPQHTPDLEDMATLHARLAQLEHDNTTLRETCAHLQHKLDQVQERSAEEPLGTEKQQIDCSLDGKCGNCDLLSKELFESKKECQKLRQLQLVLEGQVEALQAQVNECETQEKNMRAQIKALEETTTNSEYKLMQDALISDSQTQTTQQELNSSPTRPVISEMHQQMPNVGPSDSQVDPRQILDQCRQKLKDLEMENETLKEQCKAAEVEKTTLRTNIRKISEVEECLKQKVESLSQREQEYESLQAEVERMQEKLDERGNLLHIATERVKQLEETVKAHEISSQETMVQLHKANDQVRELQSIHDGLNSEYKDLKEEMLSLQQQVADLRFQVSSKDMECHAAVQADLEKLEALKVATSHVSQLEEQISQLEEEVAAEKQDLLSQKDKLTTQVEQLTQTVEEYQSQCKNLNLQLEQTENKLENAQLSLSETEKELTGSKEESRQLTQDNEQLREKIIQLLREKDALWQAKRVLEGAAGGGREWMDDSSVQECLGCRAAFSLTRRRHHCRTCGRIFCSGCSDNWVTSSASRRRVRVCDDCFSVQAELAAIVASPSPSTTTTMQQTEKGAKVDLSLTTTSSPVPITSGQPDDDEYAVISDDELQSSRLSSSPSSGSPTSSGYLSETRATLDVLTPAMLAADPPTNSEVWVGAGTRVLVPVDLPAGVSLHWNFISEPKSVSFAVLHQPPADSTSPKEEGTEEGGSPDSKQRVLIPTTRVASAQGSTIRGRLLAKQPGVYTLVFDNSCSRFTAKKVTYSLSLQENQETQQGSSIPSDASKSPPAS